MGKFVKSKILERIQKKTSGFFAERKENIMMNAQAGSSFTLDQQYKMFFWCMNAYVKGNPDKKQRLVWKALIEKVVDNRSLCDDPGFVGMKIKRRCKIIGKEKIISEQNKVWIDKELRLYFEDSMKKQLLNLTDLSWKNITSGNISKAEGKAAYNVYSKDKESFKGGFK